MVGPITYILLLINIAVFLLFNTLFNGEMMYTSICLKPLMSGHIYRLVTSSFSHSGPSHIFFNMIVHLMFGTYCENRYGSLVFFGLTNFFIFMTGILTFGLDAIRMGIYNLLGYDGDQFYFLCGIGFSAVLFSYMTVWAYSGETTCGCSGIKIPKKILPWIYLVVNKIMTPEASIMGHFSGILSVVVFNNFGFFNLLPNPGWVRDY